MRYIETHALDFEPFMEDEEEFQIYCERMNQDGQWGGNAELCAAAQVFHVSIHIVSTDPGRPVLEIPGPEEATEEVTIYLCYQGDEHYDSLHPVNQKDMDTVSHRRGNVLEEECSSKTPTEDQDHQVGLPAKPPKRGQPCPCGSRIKYKDCCRKKKKQQPPRIESPEEGSTRVDAKELEEAFQRRVCI